MTAATNVVAMPPRNSQQSLVAALRKFADQAEQGQIAGLALVIARPSDTPADPPTTSYDWKPSMALVGATMMLTKFVLDDMTENVSVSDGPYLGAS